MNENNYRDILPRAATYDEEMFEGLPVIEGFAIGSSVVFWCQRCGDIHRHDRIALPGELYKIIEQCDKDNLGDIWVFYNHEIMGDREIAIRRLRTVSSFSSP